MCVIKYIVLVIGQIFSLRLSVSQDRVETPQGFDTCRLRFDSNAPILPQPAARSYHSARKRAQIHFASQLQSFDLASANLVYSTHCRHPGQLVSRRWGSMLGTVGKIKQTKVLPLCLCSSSRRPICQSNQQRQTRQGGLGTSQRPLCSLQHFQS